MSHAAAHVAHHFDDAEQQFAAANMGMWVFLATEVLFFGGMFLGYTVYRSRYPHAWAAGSHHQDVVLGTINTALLLVSSLTVALAVHAAATGRGRRVFWYLAMTIAFGIGFLGIKGYEYAHKVHERLFPGPNFTLLKVLEKHAPAGAHVGHMVRIDDRRLLFDVEGRELLFTVPEDVAITLDKHPVELSELRPGTAMTVETSPSDSNRARRIEAQSDQVELYLSFYFAMTGLHALHMLIGIPILAAIAVMAWRGRFSPEYYTPVEIGGLYWHFVDIVWVFLFPLLYLVG